MIELIFVCTLTLADFIVPDNWRATKIEPGQRGMCLTYQCSGSDSPTRVTLTRSVMAGETVSVPDSCREATAYGSGHIIIIPNHGR